MGKIYRYRTDFEVEVPIRLLYQNKFTAETRTIIGGFKGKEIDKKLVEYVMSRKSLVPRMINVHYQDTPHPYNIIFYSLTHYLHYLNNVPENATVFKASGEIYTYANYLSCNSQSHSPIKRLESSSV